MTGAVSVPTGEEGKLLENLSSDIINLLRYLLPGFLAAWIFYSFTSYSKPSQFERVIEALIFTIIVQPCVYIVEFIFLKIGLFYIIGLWNEKSSLICSLILAIAVGFIFAYFANNDKFHSLVRTLGITRETAFPSEWFGVFSKKVTYVVLHLKDERRIYGWPIEWPSEPDKGHFSLEQVSWLEDKKEIPLSGVDAVLIRAEDVKWVEFMEKPWEKLDEQKDTKSTPAATSR